MSVLSVNMRAIPGGLIRVSWLPLPEYAGQLKLYVVDVNVDDFHLAVFSLPAANRFMSSLIYKRK